jgi:hypothetical protein
VALLGDIETVKVMLRATENISFGADIDQRLTQIQQAVTAGIEAETNRTFGDAGSATTELIWAGESDVIVLPRPAWSVTSVTYGGTLAGTTITGGTDILAGEIVHTLRDSAGRIIAIRTPYQWTRGAALAVTAVYADGNAVGDTSVPDAISYAANYLIAEVFKREQASPAGFLGPEGVVPMRDVWKDPTVTRILREYTLREVVV